MRLILFTLIMAIMAPSGPLTAVEPDYGQMTHIIVVATPSGCERIKAEAKNLQVRGFPIRVTVDPAAARMLGITRFPTTVTIIRGRIKSKTQGFLTAKQIRHLLPHPEIQHLAAEVEAKVIQTYVVVFMAPFHCPPCERLKKTIKSLTDRTGLPVVLIRDARIAARFGVKAYPASFGVVNGLVQKRAVGALTEKQLLSLLPKGSWTPIKAGAGDKFFLKALPSKVQE